MSDDLEAVAAMNEIVEIPCRYCTNGKVTWTEYTHNSRYACGHAEIELTETCRECNGKGTMTVFAEQLTIEEIIKLNEGE